VERFRLLLGYLCAFKLSCVESCFEHIGDPDPWGSVINPRCAGLIAQVKAAWNILKFIHPESSSLHSPPDPGSPQPILAFSCHLWLWTLS